MSNPQQPGKYDAVLGGNSPSLEGAAVLGGIDGVKLRLQNSDAKVRIAALEQALNYGEQGLDLVIAGLKDESWDVQYAAFLLLRSRTETKVKKSLIDFNPQGLKLEEIEVVTTNKSGQIIERQHRIARYFVEDLGNGVTLEMAAIPGGTFMMGTPENEAERRDNESPQHQVTVPSFFMGKYPVTQAQYKAIMGTNPSYFKDNGSTSLTNQRPVERISWYDAVKFCKLLSQRTGKTYRLPSEAEWEYACRAGTTRPFYFGETITTDLVNYNGYRNKPYGSAPQGEYRRQTTDVGTFPPNAFGLYDMHGNVWEWCLDNWVDNYDNAPTNGSAVTSSSNKKLQRGGSWFRFPGVRRSARRNCVVAGFDDTYGFRVVGGDTDINAKLQRGGSWNCDPDYCRSARRYCNDAGFVNYDSGFRVVCGDTTNSSNKQLLRGGSWYFSPEYCRLARRLSDVAGFDHNFRSFRVVYSDATNSSNKQVLRGGSWFYIPGNCRSARRLYGAAGFVSSYVGFRVVCSAA